MAHLQMNDQIKAISQKIDGLSLRERLMILVGVLVMLFVVWDNFLWQPMNAKQKNLQSQITADEQQLKLLKIQVSGITTQAEIDPNTDLKLQLANSKKSLKQLRTQVQKATADLVAPQRMAQLLESALRKHGTLELIELRTLGPAPLLGKSEEEVKSGQSKTESSRSNKESLNLYRHGFILEFEGDYFAVLKYLKTLETLDTAFFWDAVEYEVLEYPSARIRMRLHTLSLSEGWIGV